MRAYDVRPGICHVPRLLRREHERDRQHPAVMRKAYRFYFLPVAESCLLQRFPEFPVDHADRRIVVDSGKTEGFYFLYVFVHTLCRVCRIIAEENRDLSRLLQQFLAGKLHDEVVAVRITHEARHGTQAHGPVFS